MFADNSLISHKDTDIMQIWIMVMVAVTIVIDHDVLCPGNMTVHIK